MQVLRVSRTSVNVTFFCFFFSFLASPLFFFISTEEIIVWNGSLVSVEKNQFVGVIIGYFTLNSTYVHTQNTSSYIFLLLLRGLTYFTLLT